MSDLVTPINLVCKLHNKQVLGICLKNGCNVKDRLVCFRCTVTHHKHGSDIIPLKDILSEEATIQSLNWPFIPQGCKLKKVINSLSQTPIEGEIEKLYQDVLQQIDLNLSQVKETTIQAYTDNQNGRAKYIEDLKANYEQAYTLREVSNLLNLFSRGEVTHDEFQMNMEHFLQSESDDKISHINILGSLLSQDRVKQYLKFNKPLFEKLSLEILAHIPRIEKCFRNDPKLSNTFEFEIVPVKEYTKILMTSSREFSMNDKGVISSNVVLDRLGTYTTSFRLLNHAQGCIVVGIELDESRLTSSYWESTPAYCITCSNLDALNIQCISGESFGAKTKQGEPVVMQFCQEKNIFQVMDEKGMNIFRSVPTYQLKDKNWRMYMYNYTQSPCKFVIDNILHEQYALE